jgi:surface polysaccharide O-acyltransferase-like enzyme
MAASTTMYQNNNPATTTERRAAKTRLNGIDVVRVVAAYAVVALHTETHRLFSSAGLEWLAMTLTTACAFAVPFYFAAAGFFLGKSWSYHSDHSVLVMKRIRRLLAIFAAWAAIYAIFPFDWNKVLLSEGPYGMAAAGLKQLTERIAASPLASIISGGNAPHLWFISALMMSYALIYLVIRLRIERLAMLAGILLYEWAVIALTNLYPGVPYPIIGARTFLIGFLPTYCGWKLGRGDWTAMSYGKSLCLLTASIGLHLAESLYWTQVAGIEIVDNGYFTTTWMSGVSALMLAIGIAKGNSYQQVANLSVFTLGIYLIHPLFIPVTHGLLKRIGYYAVDLWTPLVFALSLGASWVILKIKWISWTIK